MEDPKPHEIAPIPAEFPGVEFDADLYEEVAAHQEVEEDNAAVDAISANANILHGTSTANDDENEDNNIEEVYIPPNDPTELINVNAGSDGDHNQEERDEKPVDTLSQNQDNIPNTPAMPDITAIDDRTAGDNPNGAVEIEDDEEYNDGDDASDSEDDGNSTKGVDNRYPRRTRKKNTHTSNHSGDNNTPTNITQCSTR